MGEIWDLIIFKPVLNSLVVLSSVLFNNFGLTIIVLTIIIRGCMYPLTIRQLRSTKAMQSIQPKLVELRKKFAKDKQRLAQEQMKLYKELGISPAGCVFPMLIQLPIWIALYQSIMLVLAVTPEGLLNLSGYLYSWPVVYSMVPLGSDFLWLNLALPDRFLILPILVGASMWVQQKMVTSPSTDPKQQSTSTMMLWLMPMMFTFLSLQFPSGLALYWVTSNVISVVIQYFVSGWGGLVKTTTEGSPRDRRFKKRIIQIEKSSSDYADVGADIIEQGSTGEGLNNEKSGDKRQDRGEGYSARLKEIGRQSGRIKNIRPKRR
ncbi:MAG: YidC/Oxa1 family membrane protein insertase [Dehalococcoidales bacterium]|nr:YidC/Oxa1 family membrane protein insertase [Dehalococcoidales bacterium]